MKIGYQTERLHHALHPLFLNINPSAEWEVGQDIPEMQWYFSQTDGSYLARDPERNVQICGDLYALKRHCYDYYRLSENLHLPWGIISGIRPTKLARQIRQKYPQMDLPQFQEAIWKLDRVSQEKASLLWQVLEVENECLGRERVSKKEPIHLYLGIPYCPSRCYYCSFAAGVAGEDDSKLTDYVERLKTEIRQLKPVWQEKRIRTVYFGGGTPTILKESLLEDLLSTLSEAIEIESMEEFTVEAGRPDTITPGKLDVLKRYGVGRISINPQSFSDSTLVRIGRNHSVDEVYRAYEWARERGFQINMDLIFGLNGEGVEDAENSFRRIERLRPENVTVHTLTPKRGADLSGGQRQSILDVSRGIGEMLDLWHRHMSEGDWRPYYLYRQKNIYFENIGYALPGTECIYNMETMLERQSILALGAGSISKRIGSHKISRYDMPRETMAYDKAVREGMRDKVAFFLQNS